MFQGIHLCTKAELIAASLNAALKTLQSRKTPERKDKDDGKQKRDGQKTLMVSNTRMKSSCMMESSQGSTMLTVHERLMQVGIMYGWRLAVGSWHSNFYLRGLLGLRDFRKRSAARVIAV